jgi:predicted RNA-binding protein YlxR (DUF448 family)
VSKVEAEAAESDDETGPLRRCIATGERLEPHYMVRFVVDPDGRVVPDIAGKLPGRGMWVVAKPDAFKRAVSKHLFARAAKRTVTVDPDLAAQVEQLLERQCLNLIGLARGAGILLAGFDKVKAMLQKNPAAVLIEACDGSAEGRGKLRRLAPDAPLVALFTGAALAEATGRPGVVVHAAMTRGALAKRFIIAAERLARLRGVA